MGGKCSSVYYQRDVETSSQRANMIQEQLAEKTEKKS